MQFDTISINTFHISPISPTSRERTRPCHWTILRNLAVASSAQIIFVWLSCLPTAGE